MEDVGDTNKLPLGEHALLHVTDAHAISPVSAASLPSNVIENAIQQTSNIGQSGALPFQLASPTGSTRLGSSGRTIHHHGQSPTIGGLPPLTNSYPNRQTTPNTKRVTDDNSVIGRVLLESKQLTELTSAMAAANGPSPSKRAKIDADISPLKITDQKSQLLVYKMSRLRRVRATYVEHLTEMFFLQNGGNLMDYFMWKKRPTPQLVQFLKSGTQDCDEGDDLSKPLKSPGSSRVPSLSGSPSTTTPVATSTKLPSSVAALAQQNDTKKALGGRHGMVFGHVHSNQYLHQTPIAVTQPGGISITPSTTTDALSTASTTLTAAPDGSSDTRAISKSPVKASLPGAPKSPKAGSASRSNKQPQSLYDLYTGNLGTQQAIVERARQEAQVMQRVAELRKEGMWTARRLPKVQEPSRNKAHWDYLLEEMQWLAADFCQERKWKKAGSRKISRMVLKYHQELQQKEVRAEREEVAKLKRIASHLAKQVKQFWSNVEKVVEYKQQSRLDERRKKALDLHLNFIVDQTEKYSTWLTEGLASTAVTPKSSLPGSVCKVSELDTSLDADDEFLPQASDDGADDEETIDREEAEAGSEDTQDEVSALHDESLMPFDELLRSLPSEILEQPAVVAETDTDLGDVTGDETSKQTKVDDSDFEVEEDVVDVEDTIDEEEKNEESMDAKTELQDLEDEGNLTIEELYKKYAGAYDSDFEFDADESSASESGDDGGDDHHNASGSASSTSEEDVEDNEDEEVEDNEDEEVDVESQEDVGLEYLMDSEKKQLVDQKTQELMDTTGPGKEITDIAAEAMALQPKGYTLQTTEVKTPIPFLIRHTLREYQHVGLDWLATMYAQRLNGILADEMGLGKTIQTIALISHLACQHEIWGPHLIIVPTSVMLNWELEFKKWCPALKILTYYGTQKERKLKRTGWTKTNAFHVCITSYKLVIQDHQAFKRKKWKYLVLDEAQNIKNFKSQRWQTLLNFQSQRRLLLTGTPLQNSLMELWSLMHFLMPHVFQSHREFKEWFSNPLSGMVEGNQDYNESIIRRLHKVLRPFLLRRLKDDVEKQMPKKYEHVVMCPLSKRQRFLYDDFMSQRKTKETLATGHFMSVINILMQLRKVCNHPNLFDPRPIVSPFQIEGIHLTVPSLVVHALDPHPLHDVDVYRVFPNLCELERDLPAFIAHRVRRLETSRTLITEIDNIADPPARQPQSVKPVVLRGLSPHNLSGHSSPSSPRSASPLTDLKSLLLPPTTPTSDQQLPTHSLTQLPNFVAKSLSKVALPSPPTSSISSSPLTNTSKASPPVIVSSTTTPRVLPTQPITVQIQHTDQGTRLMFPSNQLSQLPASFIHIVQTSSGQQIIASTNPSSVATNPIFLTNSVTPPVSSIATCVTTTTVSTALNTIAHTSVTPVVITPVTSASLITPASRITPQADWTTQIFQPITVTTAASPVPISAPSPAPTSMDTSEQPLSSAISVVAPIVNGSTTSTSVVTSLATHPTVTIPRPLVAKATPSIVQLPHSSLITTVKPVMKVSPLKSIVTTATTVGAPASLTTSGVITCNASAPLLTTKTVLDQPKPSPVIIQKPKPKPKSPLYIESLEEKRDAARRSKLDRISRVNATRCSQRPTYGSDLRAIVDAHHWVMRSTDWSWKGRVACQLAAQWRNQRHTIGPYFTVTRALCDTIQSPLDRLDQLHDVLDRYVFVTPRVTAPTITLNAPHPPPSHITRQRHMEHALHTHLSHKLSCLHKISAAMTVVFPELRLIQYDCGKLQTLDVLLHKLKSQAHRVLIFTQMTKMLNVLETFLNYHGHRYLRLDGTTKVEQRQALMDRFNADRRIFCFILSTRSGGLGVNLTGADTVIFYDSDWNPTMDAQAQDRCHRIGQTRDVHIYRLISEMTIEENILKKANQKRLLGDLAIEGGNFTMAHLKTQTIKDLFDEPGGFENISNVVDDNTAQASEIQVDVKSEATMEGVNVEGAEIKREESETTSTNQKEGRTETPGEIERKFEEALCKAEDETDVMAAKQVRAEQKAELAEFDETIPWDEKEAEKRKEEEDVSKVEVELAQLQKELTPIERYAVAYLEQEMDPTEMEEFLNAEEEIETAKKEWELSRLKNLKEEEERRAELEEDEMLFTYGRTSAYHQVMKRSDAQRASCTSIVDELVSKSSKVTRRGRPKKNVAAGGTKGDEGDKKVDERVHKEVGKRGRRPSRPRGSMSPLSASNNTSRSSPSRSRANSPSGSPSPAKVTIPRSQARMSSSQVKDVDLTTKAVSEVKAKPTKAIASKIIVVKENASEISAEPDQSSRVITTKILDRSSAPKIKMSQSENSSRCKSGGKLSKNPISKMIDRKRKSLPLTKDNVEGNADDSFITSMPDISKSNTVHPDVDVSNTQVKQPNVSVMPAYALVSPKVSRSKSVSSGSQSDCDPNSPKPWSNPQLVIRTRRANQHDEYKNVDLSPYIRRHGGMLLDTSENGTCNSNVISESPIPQLNNAQIPSINTVSQSLHTLNIKTQNNQFNSVTQIKSTGTAPLSLVVMSPMLVANKNRPIVLNTLAVSRPTPNNVQTTSKPITIRYATNNSGVTLVNTSNVLSYNIGNITNHIQAVPAVSPVNRNIVCPVKDLVTVQNTGMSTSPQRFACVNRPILIQPGPSNPIINTSNARLVRPQNPSQRSLLVTKNLTKPSPHNHEPILETLAQSLATGSNIANETASSQNATMSLPHIKPQTAEKLVKSITDKQILSNLTSLVKARSEALNSKSNSKET